jgi:hypothetical protein
MNSSQNIVDLGKSPLHKPAGPTWYRGSSTCNDLIEGDGLNVALLRIGATRAVLGHTTTITHRVQQRLNGRILQIDTGMLHSVYEGRGHALVIEDDALSIVSENGETDLSLIVPPRRVGYRSQTIDDTVLANILANGAVIDSKAGVATWRLVQVTADDTTVFAYFNVLPQIKGFVPELAAYRLDHLLGLDMVPVTVRREIAGQQGTLQFVPAATINEREQVVGAEARNKERCPLRKQRRAMYVFDALINNPARTPLSMLYSSDTWQLILVNHGDSFSTKEDRPDYLKNIELAIGDQWRSVLLDLDDEKLHKHLGNVLDKRRLAALAKRRDALIEASYR